ncbi:UDP-N-acetylmuramate--L-alanine ligase [Desulforhabdus amnigena]|uniref:UDP-N-acetylmuramate:L-alanyl-gamma-D-glutamyl-meso-diaminopimelate ligase n=1 Tax=Desulforhabdus amnigena TaxID=40218 RepID=A0A9W6FRP1_9BACT|nr:UDP-N-acetylmuramate--L-alanine ligase [Desulforhabdus amnigena]GLI33199.1 UDP-N-acetylmuramate:L-alanyl-gamma-D-glutamyl-meso-diaminopimelate ligase [Desulforhabdus amnigena]
MSDGNVKTVYMMGIGGIAMGTLATMLKEKGYFVVGSDVNLYPPMSDHLESLHIPLFKGYNVENLSKYPPDLVIIGNVIRRENAEAQQVLNQGIPYLSMPEAISRFFLCKHQSIVVAGTHGKSTTSSLLSWILTYAGLDPSTFVGAFLKNCERSYRIGNGRYMVLEGDEYDTAFFDKGSKFLHYRPHIGIITSIEYDHADIFPNFEAVLSAFHRFAQLIAPSDYLIINADDPHCLEVGRNCKGKVLTYGWSDKAQWRIHEVEFRPEEIRFTYQSPHSATPGSMISHLPGRHNVSNILGIMAAADIAGISMETFQEALLKFPGVKRRQDLIGETKGVLIMDDFAHHPTAVKETIDALKLFYPQRRLIAAFEPRTNTSRRSVFHSAYTSAFDGADCICIKQPQGMESISPQERLDAKKLVQDIVLRGKEAHYFSTTEELIEFLSQYCASNDLVLCMSNGSFDGLPGRLLEQLSQQSQI